jgi:hypothetical protein
LQSFSTNLKAGHKFEQRHLEAEFGHSKFFELRQRRGKLDAEFFSMQPFFFNFRFILKSYDRFTEPPPSYGFEGAVPTRIGNRVKQ